MSDLLGTRVHAVRPGDADGREPADAAKAEGVSPRDEAGGVADDAVGEQVVPETDDVPDAAAFVYVPVQPRKPGSVPNTVTFELRSIDGEPGLAVYTDRERLVAELGEHQPHVGVPVLRLLVLLGPEAVPIAVNPALEPGAEQWTEDSIRAWKTAE